MRSNTQNEETRNQFNDFQNQTPSESSTNNHDEETRNSIEDRNQRD
jgi:hypothetical protein